MQIAGSPSLQSSTAMLDKRFEVPPDSLPVGGDEQLERVKDAWNRPGRPLGSDPADFPEFEQWEKDAINPVPGHPRFL